MKALVLILTLALVSSAALRAADQPTTEDMRANARAHVQDVISQLNLSDDQKEQITPIIQKQAADLRAVRDDTAMRRIQKAKRAKEINDAASAQIRALLTPEQQKKYDELRAEMREEMKAHAQERKAAGDAGN